MSGPDRDRWARVEKLLDDALDLPADERESFVRTAAGDDSELGAEVLELVRSCDDATDFLAEPPPFVARDLIENPPPPEDEFSGGEQVGSYEVVRLLGRGGMGAVYLAERADGFFEKQVALKVIKRAGTSDESLARFEAERQILARLEHPNIVGILDGGVSDEGVPYVVMDLALGEPIDVYCDAQKLGVRRRIELFRKVCDAVQYAHRNLVVHRDLKPSNVLVTAEGQVRLLDFGIATVLEAGKAAPDDLEASPRLTPEYASPEQVRDEPSTVATDVYALGVVLYELLTGERPYTVADRTLSGIAEVVCTHTPARPSSRPQGSDTRAAEARSTTNEGLSRTLSGDLDAIILKAIEKDPDDRYGSASQLSDDLRRYVEGRPVRARPATRWYRTTKFFGRYRRQVAAVAAAIVLLAAGGITSTVQWQAAERERELREQEAERAGLAESMLLSTFADLGAGQRGALPIPPEDFVEVARLNLDRLAASARLEAGLKNKLGSISLNLSQFGAADSLFIEALDALEFVEGAELERAEAMTGLGYRSLRGSQRGDSAVTWFTRALDERQAVLEPADTAITNSMIDLGFAYYVVDRDQEALTLLRDALSRDGPPLQRARGLEFLTNALVAYSTVLADSGFVEASIDTLASAEGVAREALDVMRRASATKRPQYGNALLTLADVQVKQGHAREGHDTALEALRTYEELLGTVSQRAGTAWGMMAEASRVQGDLAGAESSFRRATQIFREAAPGSALRSSLGLAEVLVEVEEFVEAEQRLVEVLGAQPQRPDRERVRALRLLERIYTRDGRTAEAEAARRRRAGIEAAM